MSAPGGSPPTPTQNASNAEPWAIYPRNLASLFGGEDLEIYANFFSSNAARLFSRDKVRLAFWTARELDEEAVNRAAEQRETRRTIVEDEITDAKSFDSKLQVRLLNLN